MTEPATVPWLERVPAYVPGRPAPAGGLALAANEAEACSERVPAALAQPLAWNRYPDPLATPLRRALAAKHGVDPEQILVSNGSDELVQLLVSAYVGRDGSVVAADPPYAMSRITALVAGAGFTGVPLVDWRHDLDGIAAVAADIAYVVNPHNPTGTLHDARAMRAFAERARARLLVVDEAYIDFAVGRDESGAAFADGSDPGPDSVALVENGRTVVLRTFSKAYGLAGLRVGYLIGSREIVRRLRAVRAPFSVTAPGQAAALAALEDQEFLRRHVDRVRGSRDALSAKLRELGVLVPESHANFVLATGVDEPALVASLAEQGVAVRGGSGLGVPGSVRITVPAPEHLPRLLLALGRSLVMLELHSDRSLDRADAADPL